MESIIGVPFELHRTRGRPGRRWVPRRGVRAVDKWGAAAMKAADTLHFMAAHRLTVAGNSRMCREPPRNGVLEWGLENLVLDYLIFINPILRMILLISARGYHEYRLNVIKKYLDNRSLN